MLSEIGKRNSLFSERLHFALVRRLQERRVPELSGNLKYLQNSNQILDPSIFKLSTKTAWKAKILKMVSGDECQEEEVDIGDVGLDEGIAGKTGKKP